MNRFNVVDKIKDNIAITAPLVCTDDSRLYDRMPANVQKHEIVNHSAHEWVRGDVHTCTIDGYWGLLKPAAGRATSALSAPSPITIPISSPSPNSAPGPAWRSARLSPPTAGRISLPAAPPASITAFASSRELPCAATAPPPRRPKTPFAGWMSISLSRASASP